MQANNCRKYRQSTIFWKRYKQESILPKAKLIHKYGIYFPNHANQTLEDTKFICKEFKKIAKPKFV